MRLFEAIACGARFAHAFRARKVNEVELAIALSTCNKVVTLETH